MKVFRLTILLTVLGFVSIGASSPGASVLAQVPERVTPQAPARASSQRTPRTQPQEPRRLADPTNPTVYGNVDRDVQLSPEMQRFEREFGFRRRYWRPVIRVGQDYALRAGETTRGVVVAFGDARIDGRVDGDLLVVFGHVNLASTAIVDGSFVVIGGTATVAPGAMVRDEVTAIGTGVTLPDGFIFGGEHIVIGTQALGQWMESVLPWVTYGLLWGRPIVASIGWVWSVVGVFLLVYLVINLVAHEPVRASADMLSARPFGSFMTGLLVLLLAGPVSALLAVSIIGIAVIPFALAAFVVAGIVGRVSVLRWIGNSVLRPDDPQSRLQGLRSFLIGFALVTFTYMIPVLGFVAWALFGVLGLGASVLTFITAWRREHPKVEKPPRARRGAPVQEPPAEPAVSGGFAYAAPPPPAPGPAPAFAQATGFTAGPATFAGPVENTWEPTPQPAGAAIPPAMVADASELLSFPRAAFLDRAAAFVVDILLLLFVNQLFDNYSRGYRDDEWFFPMMLVYFIGFWTWKGTTIGGIVTNLRVVKANGGELTFLEGLVRGLTGILSFGLLGIGVLWILRNDELAPDGRPARQAWHDIAAGTYVVKVPKGYPLP
jgi:uncharacterized RDD family membrane protein YckC